MSGSDFQIGRQWRSARPGGAAATPAKPSTTWTLGTVKKGTGTTPQQQRARLPELQIGKRLQPDQPIAPPANNGAAANGDAAQEPAPKSKASQFFSNIFKNVRKATASDKKTGQADQKPVNSLKTEKQRIFEAQRKELKKALPDGISIDDSGRISGSYSSSQFNQSLKNESFVDFYNKISEKNLRTFETTDNKLPAVSSKNGQENYKISTQAASDFWRLNNLTITKNNEPVPINYNSEDGNKQNERNFAVADALHTLCHTPEDKDGTAARKALVVLSSVINQQFSRVVSNGMRNDQGDVALRASDTRVKTEVVVFNSNGEKDTTKNISPIADAEFFIERNGDTIDITIKSTSYYESVQIGTEKQDLPHMQGAAIIGNSTIKYSIDMQAIQSGKPCISHASSETTFSGYMPKP